ncbi:MAG: stage III sporulation protein AF [Lachnospiraceae bacterium]|nr:stage III sporulation protein AF [Lachnospiraceae bacterium]
MREQGKRHFSKRYGKLLISLLLMILSFLLSTKEAKAAAASGEMDYSEIQQVIDDIMSYGNKFDFSSYVEQLVNGEVKFSPTEIGLQLINSVKGELKANISTFGRLITIALTAALFTNLSMAFKNSQVSETGYYVTYLLLFGLLASTFVTASGIASKAVESLLEFMKALAPAYFLAIGFSTGSATSLIYYEAALMLISIVDLIIIKVVIPLIDFYLVITLANNLSKEDMLSKLAGLFGSIINWLLKSLLAAVVGLGAIQGLIVPVADRVKRSALLKASAAIPGIGDAIGGVTETVIGAGILLKNAIGVAGLVVIITICAVPFLKLLMIVMIYKAGSAVLQPISDKRVIECISASAKSSGMLLKSVFVGAVLFLLSITIAAVTTGSVQ